MTYQLTIRHRLVIIVMALGWLFVACQPAPPEPLPTQANIDDIATAQVATNTAEAILNPPTATATSSRPTLPPTFTPTNTFTPEPIENTPASNDDNGTIIYNYNGDSIAALNPDGSADDIIVTFGVDQPIDDIAPSPDGTLIAFVGPFDDAREIYVTNRTGDYLQRISCLTYADVRDPIWTPDSASLTFYAAPTLNTDGALYQAAIDGSNNCPVGNNQRVLVDLPTSELRGMTWNRLGTMLVYSIGDGPLYVYNTADNTISPYSSPTPFGPDTEPTQNPATNDLAYLTSIENTRTGSIGSGWAIIPNSSTMPNDPWGARGNLPFSRRLKWGQNGEVLLLFSLDSIVALEWPGGSSLLNIEDVSIPAADISPDGEEMVYTRQDENGVWQIYIERPLSVRGPRQVTTHTEGIMTNLFWLPPQP